MKLIFLIMASFSMALCSCKTTAQIHHIENSCDTVSLKLEIQQSWMYDVKREYFITNDSFINRLSSKYKDCFYGSDTSTVIKYFGRNFKTGRVKGNDTLFSFMQYSLSPKLPLDLKPIDYDIIKLKFYLDSKYQVGRIEKEWMIMSVNE